MQAATTPQGTSAGRTLRMMREAHGVSLRALAEAADVSPGHLSRVESGERIATEALVLRLCDVIAGLPPLPQEST